MKKKKIIEYKLNTHISRYRKNKIIFSFNISGNSYRLFEFPLEKLEDFIVLLENIINNQKVQDQDFPVRSITTRDLELLKLNNIKCECFFTRERFDKPCDVNYLISYKGNDWISYKDNYFYICKKHLKLLYTSLNHLSSLHNEEKIEEIAYVEEEQEQANLCG